MITKQACISVSLYNEMTRQQTCFDVGYSVERSGNTHASM